MYKTAVTAFDVDNIYAGLLRLISSPGDMSKLYKYIKTEYFLYGDSSPQAVTVRNMVDIMIAAYKNYGTKLTVSNFQSYAGNFKSNANNIITQEQEQEAVKKVASRFTNDIDLINKSNDEGVFQLFLDYLKLLQIAQASRAVNAEYKAFKPNAALEEMQKAVDSINSISLAHACLFDTSQMLNTLKKYQEHEKGRTFYLGPCEMDREFGGFRPQTLNVFIGLTNTGKSQMVYHLIRKCIQYKMAAHVTLVEDNEETFIERVLASVADLPISVVRAPNEWTKEIEQKLITAQALITQYIAVDFVYGQSVDVIQQRKLDHDMARRMQGKEPVKVDILDYTGHIASKSPGEKKFEKMAYAYAARKDFALSYDKIVFDFAQLNRDGSKISNKRGDNTKQQSVLTISELAGSFDISAVCDTIISLNRDEDDEANSTIRLHLCKVRRGKKGKTFKFNVDFSRARYLIDEGCVENTIIHGTLKTGQATKDAQKQYDNSFKR